MISVIIDTKGAPENAAARVRTFVGGEGARKIIGYEANRTVRDHLQGLDATRRNKLGAEPSHYYNSARRATEFYIEGFDVIVSIAQVGMSLHYFGGTVSAGQGTSYASGTPTRYLTIPATAEAYGKRASDFPDLVVVWGKNGPVGLAIGEEATGSLYLAVTRGPMLAKRAKKRPGKLMFWLKENITIKADPTVLPDDEFLLRNCANRLTGAIARRFSDESTTVEFDDGGPKE